jgi:putative transposase
MRNFKELWSVWFYGAEATNYPVSSLCKLFNVSRSGYYAFLQRKGVDKDEEVKALIKRVYERYDGKYGYRETHYFCCKIMDRG